MAIRIISQIFLYGQGCLNTFVHISWGILLRVISDKSLKVELLHIRLCMFSTQINVLSGRTTYPSLDVLSYSSKCPFKLNDPNYR